MEIGGGYIDVCGEANYRYYISLKDKKFLLGFNNFSEIITPTVQYKLSFVQNQPYCKEETGELIIKAITVNGRQQYSFPSPVIESCVTGGSCSPSPKLKATSFNFDKKEVTFDVNSTPKNEHIIL